jgi:hypothetical protein
MKITKIRLFNNWKYKRNWRMFELTFRNDPFQPRIKYIRIGILNIFLLIHLWQ